MKTFGRLILIVILIFVTGQTGFTQSAVPQADSLQVREKKIQTTSRSEEQKAKADLNRQQAGKNNPSQAVKRIKGGRPDMTRAKGARPPSVVRPSGSGIPKGVGKPGGAGRKGGR